MAGQGLAPRHLTRGNHASCCSRRTNRVTPSGSQRSPSCTIEPSASEERNRDSSLRRNRCKTTQRTSLRSATCSPRRSEVSAPSSPASRPHSSNSFATAGGGSLTRNSRFLAYTSSQPRGPKSSAGSRVRASSLIWLCSSHTSTPRQHIVLRAGRLSDASKSMQFGTRHKLGDDGIYRKGPDLVVRRLDLSLLATAA
jgi:hypothetical protein